MIVFKKVITYLQAMDPKQYKRSMLLFFACTVGLVSIVSYYIQQKKNELITHTKQLHKLAEKSITIIQNHHKMAKEEQRLKELLDKNKDFTMKGFFEQFCKEQNLIPEAGWDARTEPLNERFDEIILPATFKNLNTERLVKILEELDKKELVLIKVMDIRSEENKQLTVNIMLATKRYKAFD